MPDKLTGPIPIMHPLIGLSFLHQNADRLDLTAARRDDLQHPLRKPKLGTDGADDWRVMVRFDLQSDASVPMAAI